VLDYLSTAALKPGNQASLWYLCDGLQAVYIQERRKEKDSFISLRSLAGCWWLMPVILASQEEEKSQHWRGMVVHTCNPSTWEAETGGL
jgi:hypothetical protein